MSKSFVEAQSSEVRDRCQATIDWWEGGGKEAMRAGYVADQREYYRKRYANSRTGWPWARRPLTEAEIERNIDDDMGGSDNYGLGGNWRVNLRMAHYEEKVSEIKTLLTVASNGEHRMFVDALLWRYIIAHS